MVNFVITACQSTVIHHRSSRVRILHILFHHSYMYSSLLLFPRWTLPNASLMIYHRRWRTPESGKTSTALTTTISHYYYYYCVSRTMFRTRRRGLIYVYIRARVFADLSNVCSYYPSLNASSLRRTRYITIACIIHNCCHLWCERYI